MKLSKKSAALQRAIHKALASGKALSGLIVGLAATVSGCRDHSPATTMGDYPNPNTVRETRTRRSAAVRGKMLLGPERECTNTVNETNGVFVTDGEMPPPAPKSTNTVNEVKAKRNQPPVPGKSLKAPDGKP